MNIETYLDNTAPESDYEDLGVLRFARDFLPPCKENRASLMHYKMLKSALDLYNPRHRVRTDRQMYNLVHREGAKTTYFSYVFPLYVICTTNLPLLCMFDDEMGIAEPAVIQHEKEFILLVSETGGAAERMTSNIRAELSTNRELCYMFGDLTPRSLPNDPFLDQEWRRNMFRLANGCMVVGLGAGQQIRGINVGMRPSLLIADDIYSQKGVLTEETREKTRFWFFAEAINTVDSRKGKVISIGTIVHEDTVTVDITKNPSWQGFRYPIIGTEELSTVLAQCTIDYDRRTIKLPSATELDAIQKGFKTLSWADRHSLYYIMSMYKDRYEGGRLNQFYQEYLHILQSPEDESFTDNLVTMCKPLYDYSYNNSWVEFQYQNMTWKGLTNLVLGIDLAAGEKSTSDNTAMMVGGYVHAYPQIDGYDVIAAQAVNADKRNGVSFPIILDGYANKMDMYDNTRNFGTTAVMKKGVINEAERLCLKYRIETVAVECTATQSLIARELRRYFLEKRKEMQANKRYYPNIRVVEKVPTSAMKKEERIKHALLPVMQGHRITIVNGESKAALDAWTQLRLLGVGSHDDQADAIAYSISEAKKANKVDWQTIDIHQENRLVQMGQKPYPAHNQEAIKPMIDWQTI